MIPKRRKQLNIISKSRIETELEVKTYLQNLNYALDNGAKIEFQAKRIVDDKRDIKFTNQYTVAKLFPNENPVEALKRELRKLTIEDYMRTVQDLRFPKRSEMREFGKVYNGTDDVYIKIRVELIGLYGNATTFVMSFHFAEKAFYPEMFPYKKR
jgi:c-di-GMP-related signal transduction protein